MGTQMSASHFNSREELERCVVGTEVHGCFLGKEPFELAIERYVAIRHLGFQVGETGEHKHRSCEQGIHGVL